ncbi:hypothetical protein L596_024693 [Steinernema carpocapsae]|uniref:Secreted protein n=1 Tax=Steinernema carpocapsae TaxID=34508 RepID=A0A4U5M6E0_STECR|nr:hypothetical protein L596_024693 [Steinernema carpocapsae]
MLKHILGFLIFGVLCNSKCTFIKRESFNFSKFWGFHNDVQPCLNVKPHSQPFLNCFQIVINYVVSISLVRSLLSQNLAYPPNALPCFPPVI